MKEIDLFVQALLSSVRGSGRDQVLDSDIENAYRYVLEQRAKAESERRG